jgi:flagellar basal-body rod protein FlgC
VPLKDLKERNFSSHINFCGENMVMKMFLNSLNIPASGMTAQRLRMDIISQNIANQDTTVGVNGQPYRRKSVTIEEQTQETFQNVLGVTENSPGGVKVVSINEDMSDLKLEYDPSSPNANAQGYIQMPNVDTVTEMTDMMEASKSYNADIQAFNALKGMAVTALQIGK